MPAARPLRALPDGWVHRTAKKSYLEGAGARGGFSWIHALWILTRHEFRTRYRAQALGVVWSMLNPVIMMAILSIIFSTVFKSDQPNFPIFLLIGLVVWGFVSASLNAATGSFIAHSEIIKRTIFPRQLLPLSVMLSYGLNFLIEASVVLLFIPIFPSAFKLSPALALVPVLLFFLVMLLAGVALATSVLNVIYRDMAYLVTTALLILHWLTPVVYPLNKIPEPYQTIIKCNPLTGILMGLRDAIMNGQVPSLMGWASVVVPSLVVFGLGWVVFKHYERQVLDYV